MAGMNRLGAGPKKPGIVRPIDPNRFKSIELQPEGVEGDLEYQKLVKEVEDGVGGRQAGWLFGRGAFDKTDLQYLKDEEDKKKYMELEQTEKEKATFAQLRAQHDRGGEDPGGGVVRQLVNQNLQAKKEHANASKQTQLLARMVKVKRGNSSAEPQTGASDAKRAKVSEEKETKDRGDGSAVLPGLVGDYGSDSEAEDDE